MKTRDERHHVADRTAGPPGPKAPTPHRDATDESLLLDDFFPSEEEEEEEEDKNASNHRFTTTEESDANREGSPRAGKL